MQQPQLPHKCDFHYLDSNKETNANLTCQLLKSNSLDKVIQCDMLSKNNITKSRWSSYSTVSDRMKLAVKRKLSLSLITILVAHGFPYPTIMEEFTFIYLTFMLMKNDSWEGG